MLDQRQLRAFIAVAEELSFSAAARRLHISQSPLSFTIRGIERELGVSLFTRTTRKVELTLAGKALLAEAHSLLRRHENVNDRLLRIQQGEEGRLRIGFVGSMLFREFAALQKQLHTQFPNVAYQYTELNSAYQLDELLAGDIDLGFIHALPLPESIHAQVIWQDAFIICVPDNAEFSNVRDIQDLRHAEFIFFSRSAAPKYYEKLLLQCAQAGLTPNIKLEAPHWLSVLMMVSQGMGVSVVPSCLQSSGIPGLRYIAIPAGQVTNILLVHARHTQNRLTQLHQKLIKNYYSRLRTP